MNAPWRGGGKKERQDGTTRKGEGASVLSLWKKNRSKEEKRKERRSPLGNLTKKKKG